MCRLFKSFLFVGLAVILFSCKKDIGVDTEQISHEQQVVVMGAKLVSQSSYAKIPEISIDVARGTTLPPVLNVPMPPVGNQGNEGSCVSWATAYAVRSSSYAATLGTTVFTYTDNVFSPEYVYNSLVSYANDCTVGTSVTEALDLIKTKGVCKYATMPPVAGNCTTMPSASQNSEAALFKISGYGTVRITTSAIKNSLVNGKPIIVAGPVNTDFRYLASGAILGAYNSATYMGNHCYCIIGYDDTKSAFRFQNSWGQYWASSGYGWISYASVADWVKEAYTIR